MAQRIPTSDSPEYAGFFKLAHPSDRTIKERNKFAAQLDSFATFYWANTNMFNEFGAFIINEKKGSLKLYNGPSFKNSYSKTQFQDGYTNLTGITFETQTITFTIGVYWISIEDYRILINLLHPYEVNMLYFSFEQTYGYFCKLQNIKDSTRYIVGKEDTVTSNAISNLNYSQLPSGNSGGPRYYTELTLTFEVMGAQCAKQIEPIKLFTIPTSPGVVWDDNSLDDEEDEEDENDNSSSESSGSSEISWGPDTGEESYTITLNFQDPETQKIQPKFISDLDYPFELELPSLYLTDTSVGQILVYAELHYLSTDQHQPDVKNNIPIFEIGLKNIRNSSSPISLKFNSEHGLIYWTLGNQSKLLNLLSTESNGERIVEFMDTKAFYWPGQLNFPDIKNCAVYLKIKLTNNVCLYVNGTIPNVSYSAQKRTNVI